MKISDILRDFADSLMLQDVANIMDKHERNKPPEPAPAAVVPNIPVPVGEPEDPPTDKFMPPLQLKLELEKRAAGIKSIYDEDDTEECDDEAADALMLQQLKKNAGLSSIMTKFSDDAPLDS
jgi:hypothetical protein